MRRSGYWVSTLLLLVVAACARQVTDPTATAPNPTSAPTLQPAATPTRPAETATAPPVETGAPAAFPTPEVDFNDLSLQQAAMRPEFAADVAAVAEAGASRYFIDVALDPAPAGGPQIEGVVRVRYTNTEAEPLEAVYFRLYPNLPALGGEMIVEGVMVDGAPVETSLESQDSALRVPLPQPLPPGQVADISLRYRTTVPTDTSAGYGVYVYFDGVFALAGFYPAIAVYDDEGWNIEVAPPWGDVTYLDTSLYHLRFTLPDDQVVVTSGSMVARVDNGDGTRTIEAVSGPMRDFYLAMSPDYAVLSETVDGVTVSSYYLPGHEVGARQALQVSVDSLRLFNDRFGTYPYAELDVAATPTTAGGVEYPGVIVIAGGLYADGGNFFKHVAAHEVAHQWWYGLVGNDQVDDPWLDEALTNYSAYLYWQEFESEEAAALVRGSLFDRAYAAAQSSDRDRGVAGPVASFNGETYGLIVYGKGPLYFDALRGQVGDELFFAILQAYFARFRYGVATPEGWQEVVAEVAGEPESELYDFWILGRE
ncbi:MAG: M1 family metallopeptidase [Anaerolineae bacterium]